MSLVESGLSVVLANFHGSGYVFCMRMVLNRERRYEREFGCRFLSMEACILSGPVEAFLRFL